VIDDELDPLGIGRAALGVWQAMATHPSALLQTQTTLVDAWMSLALRTVAGQNGAAAPPAPVISPAPNDARWKHPAWNGNPTFDALKQGYLLATRAALDSIDATEGVDDETKSRVRFFAKQFCDAMSPTNFAFLNPAVIEEALRTGGKNFDRGARNFVQDLRDNDGRPALVDRSAFEVGRNVAASSGEVVFRNELIELIHYTPTTSTVYRRPLVIVPPWINKFYILDLQPANSFIKYATDNGLSTFVISWRNPDASLADFGPEEYLELGSLAAVRAACAIAGSPDVNQIGYCIGGTLTAMQLGYLAKTEPSLVNAVTFFAALTDFSDVGEIKNFLSAETVEHLEKKMHAEGVLPASDMAAAFTMLRANDLVWNVAVNRYLLGKDAPAFDLLYWNDDATRMTAKMHSYYLTNMYVRNALVAGTLSHRGVPIELGAIGNDTFSVASVEDHIAPWRSVYKMTQSLGGEVRFRLGHSGHIAGIISPPGAAKGHYWRSDATPPSPDDWLAGADKIQGSWWPDWLAWIGPRSGDRIPAPERPGSAEYPSLGPAPGTYVLEKA
jgi:polyhydroxyalkanoate synthase